MDRNNIDRGIHEYIGNNTLSNNVDTYEVSNTASGTKDIPVYSFLFYINNKEYYKNLILYFEFNKSHS